MKAFTQKKVSISQKQEQFIENYAQWGFPDQSSLVRAALESLMKELKRKQRKDSMAQKAQELISDYTQDKALTDFTALDAEDFK